MVVPVGESTPLSKTAPWTVTTVEGPTAPGGEGPFPTARASSGTSPMETAARKPPGRTCKTRTKAYAMSSWSPESQFSTYGSTSETKFVKESKVKTSDGSIAEPMQRRRSQSPLQIPGRSLPQAHWGKPGWWRSSLRGIQCNSHSWQRTGRQWHAQVQVPWGQRNNAGASPRPECDWDFQCDDHGLQLSTDQPTKHAQYEPPRSRGATQFAGVNTEASRAITKRAQNGISGLRLTRDTGDRGTTNQLKRPVGLSQIHTTREQINVTQQISSTRSSRWGSSDGNLDVTSQTDFQLNPPSLLEGLWLMQIWSQHLSTWSQPDDWTAKRVQQRAVEVATNLKSKGKAQGDSNQDARQKGETDEANGWLLAVAGTG